MAYRRRSTRPSRSRSAPSSSRSRPRMRVKASRPSSRSAPRNSRAARLDLGIKGKVALVTGGARSLGKQDCLTLAAEGCRVIVLDLNADGALETAKEINDAGGTARGYAADITDRPALTDAIHRAEREVGPVDICVNNAGFIYTVGQLKDMKDEEWDQNLAINLTGT